MNKKITLTALSFFSIVILATWFFNGTNEETYSPREKVIHGIEGYSEYITMIRNNEITGKVSRESVEMVMDQMKTESRKAHKAEWPVKWEFSGPDNVGGRTRAILIDRNDNKRMYTGGVSGALFRSDNKGSSWYPLTSEDDNFGVVSIAQTIDNTIFYGTGEAFGATAFQNGAEEGTPGFGGYGIFKSTDGVNFSQLTNTLGYGNINVLESHPTENIILAGTSAGLYYSSNGGDSWTRLKQGNCRDVKISKNGVVLAYVGSSIFRSTNADDEQSYSIITGFDANQRMCIAWSESDPNYAYIVSAGLATINGISYSDAFNGLYKSTDAGVNWTEVVATASKYFAPLTNVGIQSQGSYDMAIGVHPRNKDRVFIGGVGFAEWTPTEGPKIVGNNFDSPFNPFGIHADKHCIVFDNTGEDPIMYIGSDGGIAKTTNAELDNYIAINIGYTTTQFYGLAASTDGMVLGGTQDNNTILITKESFPRKNGVIVLGGDGFQTEISELNTSIMFAESQYGNLRRTVNTGQSMSSIWDNRVRSEFISATRVNGYFNTAMHLWENQDALERYKDVGLDSITEEMYQSRLFFCLNPGVWMANNATALPFQPEQPSNETIRWFKIAAVGSVHYLASTRSGNSLFIGTTNGRIYRVDGLNKANFDTTELVNPKAISDSLTLVNITSNMNLGSRTITGIAVDPTNDNRVVISVGNYGNTTYVYRTNNALDPVPSWTAIQGNLPQFPVYHAIIDRTDPDIIVLGTEFGIWACTNGSSSSPTWVQSLDGVNPNVPFPKSPVFELVQVAEKNWTGSKIYAGTHGMGLWESASLLTGIEPDDKKSPTVSLLAYPNPANNSITVKCELKGEYTLNVYDMSGRIVHTEKGKGNGLIKLNTANLIDGNYFLEVLQTDKKAVAKFIVQH